jgi:hypothetical protein
VCFIFVLSDQSYMMPRANEFYPTEVEEVCFQAADFDSTMVKS